MTYKKLWAVLCFVFIAAALILFGFTFLNNGSDGQSTHEDNGKLITVGFSQLGSESEWRLANTESMIEALSEENGFELIFDNAKQKQENQLLAIRNFIQQEVDYIVIAPIAETGWDSVLKEAKNAGIPVIIVDRQVSVEDDSLYVSWVGSDFRSEGESAISWLERESQNRFGEAAALEILHVQGTAGATAQLERTRALEGAVEEHDSWNIVETIVGEFTEARGYEVVRDFLKSGRYFNVIYCENDNMAFGAMKAMDEAGISYGPHGDVIVITFDAVHAALEMCLEGKIDLCVECNPLHGPRVAKLIKQIEGGTIPLKLVYVPETRFSYETLTQEILDGRTY